ncbi:MAG: hypothetical protein J6K29_02065 [Clostridia bacterium]|nr:hypothetical protein [Clostridia bacterium]
MSENSKSLTVNSIGICVAATTDKKTPPCIIVAYSVGQTAEDIRLLAMNLPRKGLYGRGDFLNAIAKAEKARQVIYKDYNCEDKDLYICRPAVGDTYEIIPRDERAQRFGQGFAEIETAALKFEVEELSVHIGKKLSCRFLYRVQAEYPVDSYEYATVNAYNACLLGRVFSREEFRLETGDGKKAKYEVRTSESKYVDMSTLYVRSVKNSEQGVVEYYVTEPLLEINGEDMTRKTYQIIYKNILKDYSINRFD